MTWTQMHKSPCRNTRNMKKQGDVSSKINNSIVIDSKKKKNEALKLQRTQKNDYKNYQ
jgi:hypothetical protein